MLNWQDWRCTGMNALRRAGATILRLLARLRRHERLWVPDGLERADRMISRLQPDAGIEGIV